jgi:transposase
MSEVSIIGIDLAKRVFQLHGACANGAVSDVSAYGSI